MSFSISRQSWAEKTGWLANRSHITTKRPLAVRLSASSASPVRGGRQHDQFGYRPGAAPQSLPLAASAAGRGRVCGDAYYIKPERDDNHAA